MRLREIDRGDRLTNRPLIRLISIVSGMRLRDAVRVAIYHKGFFGAPVVHGPRRRRRARGCDSGGNGVQYHHAVCRRTRVRDPFDQRIRSAAGMLLKRGYA
jgi:hypothetical protein